MADQHPPAGPPPASPAPLVEGLDYTVEAGRWVFTERFLRGRGYCCESGCRHCPWGYRKRPGCPADADRG